MLKKSCLVELWGCTWRISGPWLRPTPEVSPDEGFRREVETSINSMLLGCFRLI